MYGGILHCSSCEAPWMQWGDTVTMDSKRMGFQMGRWQAGGTKLPVVTFQLHQNRSRFPLMSAQQEIWAPERCMCSQGETEQKTNQPPASEQLVLGEPNRFAYWCRKKKPAVVQRDTPATRPSQQVYLQLREGRGFRDWEVHRTFLWTLPMVSWACSAFITDWLLPSWVPISAYVTSAFQHPMCWCCILCISSFQLWFLKNWVSTNEQITTTRYHPTTKVHCSFGIRFDRILPICSEPSKM